MPLRRTIAGEGCDDPLPVCVVVNSRKPEAHGDARLVRRPEPGFLQNVADDRAHDRDRRGEIDVNVGGGAGRLGERAAPGVPDAPSAPRRPAVDADGPGAPRSSGDLAPT